MKPPCVECISLWLNCILPLVNSEEHFLGVRHTKTSGTVNNSDLMVAHIYFSNTPTESPILFTEREFICADDGSLHFSVELMLLV